MINTGIKYDTLVNRRIAATKHHRPLQNKKSSSVVATTTPGQHEIEHPRVSHRERNRTRRLLTSISNLVKHMMIGQRQPKCLPAAWGACSSSRRSALHRQQQRYLLQRWCCGYFRVPVRPGIADVGNENNHELTFELCTSKASLLPTVLHKCHVLATSSQTKNSSSLHIDVESEYVEREEIHVRTGIPQAM